MSHPIDDNPSPWGGRTPSAGTFTVQLKPCGCLPGDLCDCAETARQAEKALATGIGWYPGRTR